MTLTFKGLPQEIEQAMSEEKSKLTWDVHTISEETSLGDDGVVYTVKHFKVGRVGHGLDWRHRVGVFQGSKLVWASVDFDTRKQAALIYSEAVGVINEIGSLILRQNQKSSTPNSPFSGINRTVLAICKRKGCGHSKNIHDGGNFYCHFSRCKCQGYTSQKDFQDQPQYVQVGEMAFYIDPINGDDSGSGTSKSPLKTFTELSRRTGNAITLGKSGDVTVVKSRKAIKRKARFTRID